MRRFALVASALLLTTAPAAPLVAPAAAQAPAAVETRQIGTATLQNVPPIPD
jgi:hypothetical protein